jgi:hypothetical protein
MYFDMWRGFIFPFRNEQHTTHMSSEVNLHRTMESNWQNAFCAVCLACCVEESSYTLCLSAVSSWRRDCSVRRSTFGKTFAFILAIRWSGSLFQPYSERHLGHPFLGHRICHGGLKATHKSVTWCNIHSVCTHVAGYVLRLRVVIFRRVCKIAKSCC